MQVVETKGPAISEQVASEAWRVQSAVFYALKAAHEGAQLWPPLQKALGGRIPAVAKGLKGRDLSTTGKRELRRELGDGFAELP